MTARHHHYVSQFYLKGFTKGRSKKSKLVVIDFNNGTIFETVPRNVCGVRDFNRINVEGIKPDAIESELANFEGKAAVAIKNVENSLAFIGEDKNCILSLIALYAIRSPDKREHFRKLNEQISNAVMDLSLSTEERWKSQIEKMKADGFEIPEIIPYKDMKNFSDRKAYTIEVSTEHHIVTEMECMDAILTTLAGRKWLLIQSTEESGPFITTDNPVNLTWNEPDKIHPLLRQSPGFGRFGTQVYFPISSDLALLGDYESEDGIRLGTKNIVAALNTKMILSMPNQLFAPKLRFNFSGRNGTLLDGSNILKEMLA